MENHQAKSLGQRLKKIRKENGLTLQDLSEKIDRLISTISNWENDKSIPDAEDIIKLSKIYKNISIDFILTGKKYDDFDLSQYKKVTEQVLDRIEKTEIPYTISEVNKITKELGMAHGNKTIGRLLVKLALILFKPGKLTEKDHREFDSTWYRLPPKLQEELRSMYFQKRFFDLLLYMKNKQREGGEEK